jgi:hypothetical protein
MWVSQNVSGMYCFKTVYYLSLYNSLIFHTSTLIFNAFCPLGYKFLYVPRKNAFSWLTSHTSTSSFTCCYTGRKGVLTKHLGVDQTHDNPQRPDENKMEDAPTPRSEITQGCQWCGGQFADGHFHAKMQQPLLAFLGSCSSIWSLSILEHLIVTVTVMPLS